MFLTARKDVRPSLRRRAGVAVWEGRRGGAEGEGGRGHRKCGASAPVQLEDCDLVIVVDYFVHVGLLPHPNLPPYCSDDAAVDKRLDGKEVCVEGGEVAVPGNAGSRLLLHYLLSERNKPKREMGARRSREEGPAP